MTEHPLNRKLLESCSDVESKMSGVRTDAQDSSRALAGISRSDAKPEWSWTASKRSSIMQYHPSATTIELHGLSCLLHYRLDHKRTAQAFLENTFGYIDDAGHLNSAILKHRDRENQGSKRQAKDVQHKGRSF